MDTQVTVVLTVAEWNVIVNALAGRPFAEVAGIIPQIQNQASQQLPPPEAPESE